MIFKYVHSEWFEDIEVPQISPHESIFLWGAGKVGSVVAHSLMQKGRDFVAFIDTAKDKQGQFFYGHKIISPEEFYAKYSDATVICACAFPNVLDEIRKNNIIKAYDPVFLLKEFDFDGYQGEITVEFARRSVENALRNYALYYKKGNLIERLLFMITDKCSLRCKNCDGYMPYHKNPKNDTFESIVKSYNRIMDVCGVVDNIDILGGEPLVHPDVAQIVSYFVNDNRCRKVTIISNGTIIPSAALVEVLKSSKCAFRISDYGQLSSKKEQLIALFKEEKIQFEITNYQYWDNIPRIQYMNETPEQLDAKYAACTANVFYIKHGKLFYCTFVAGLSSISENLLPDFKSNYVDLLSEEKDAVLDKIKKFVNQLRDRKHIAACKYCPGSHCIQFENKQPVAEQAKGILPIDNLFKDGKKICYSQI